MEVYLQSGRKGRVFFSESTPGFFIIFLWMISHFINVIFCILDLTNSLREIGRVLQTGFARVHVSK